MAKFCSQCGSPINEDALFCSSCGAKVAETEKATVDKPTEQKTEPIKVEEVKNSNNAANENKTSDTAVENENTEAVNESQPANEVNEATASEPEPTNNEDVQAQETQKPSEEPTAEEPTAIDKGIAIAKDKIGDGYEKFKTSPNRDKYIGFSAIGIVIIVVICLLVSIFFGGGYKSAVKDYMNAVKGDNFSAYVDATPKIIYQAILERDYNGDKSDMKKSFKKSEGNISSAIDDIDYDILDVDKLDSDDVDELEDNLRSQYELYVDEKIKVSKAYEIDVRVIAELEDDFDVEETRIKQTLIVAKVNGDWGVINNPASLLNTLV